MELGLSKRAVNRQRWLAHINSWKRSGLTQKAFCQQHGLGLASFRRWRAIAMREGKPADSTVVTFLPVNVVEPGAAGQGDRLDALTAQCDAEHDRHTGDQIGGAADFA